MTYFTQQNTLERKELPKDSGEKKTIYIYIYATNITENNAKRRKREKRRRSE